MSVDAVFFCFVALVASAETVVSKSTVTVLLDAYSLTSTLTDNPSTLPLGATVILSCRTAGIPQGTDYSYTWSCPGGSSCNVGQGRNPNRKTYEDRLVLHILSIRDAGKYRCKVDLAMGDMVGEAAFTLRVEGDGLVLHHGSNLITNNEFITDVQDITSDGMTSVSCTATSTDKQQPQWRAPKGEILSTATNSQLYQIVGSNSATLVINGSSIDNFSNAKFTCNTTQHAASVNLYFGPGGNLRQPKILGAVESHSYYLIASPRTLLSATRLLMSYQRLDFGPALTVEYQEVVVKGLSTAIPSIPTIPGALYTVTMWGLSGKAYSMQPAVLTAALLHRSQVPSAPRSLTLTRTFTGGLELNWIPPKETNAVNIRYEIQYGLNTSDYTTVDTGRSDTYYNLTGLQHNTTYYIRVVAVNDITSSGVLVGMRSEGQWAVASTPEESGRDVQTGRPAHGDHVAIIAGALVCGALVVMGLAAVAAVLAMAVKYGKLQARRNVYSVPDASPEDHYEDVSKYACREEGIYDTVDGVSITDACVQSSPERETAYQELMLEELQKASYAHVYSTPRSSCSQLQISTTATTATAPPLQNSLVLPPRISRYISPPQNSPSEQTISSHQPEHPFTGADAQLRGSHDELSMNLGPSDRKPPSASKQLVCEDHNQQTLPAGSEEVQDTHSLYSEPKKPGKLLKDSKSPTQAEQSKRTCSDPSQARELSSHLPNTVNSTPVQPGNEGTQSGQYDHLNTFWEPATHSATSHSLSCRDQPTAKYSPYVNGGVVTGMDDDAVPNHQDQKASKRSDMTASAESSTSTLTNSLPRNSHKQAE